MACVSSTGRPLGLASCSLAALLGRGHWSVTHDASQSVDLGRIFLRQARARCLAQHRVSTCSLPCAPQTSTCTPAASGLSPRHRGCLRRYECVVHIHFVSARSSRLQSPLQDSSFVEHAQQTLFQLTILASLTTASVMLPEQHHFPSRPAPAAAPLQLRHGACPCLRHL